MGFRCSTAAGALPLNGFGQAHLDHEDRVLRELDVATSELHDMAGLKQGIVSIAAGALHWLPEVLRPFQENDPTVRFRLLTRSLPGSH